MGVRPLLLVAGFAAGIVTGPLPTAWADFLLTKVLRQGRSIGSAASTRNAT
ncbi:hypothetical protein [Streptomyces spectabilis]|uniref:hypothetical protein n=1 Tax=Streptomyces spectabilis TaxID=68270 RepID=UPI0013782B09|nr:hypothetical protein [Streptomyces spectabilis]